MSSATGMVMSAATGISGATCCDGLVLFPRPGKGLFRRRGISPYGIGTLYAYTLYPIPYTLYVMRLACKGGGVNG